MTRTRLCAAAAIVLTFPAGASTQVPEPEAAPVSDSLRSEVLRFVASYYDAFSARDWESFRSHFWPGATITTVWQRPGEAERRVVVTMVEEFIEQAPSGPGSKEIFEERMLSAEVRARGSLAVVFARYRARFGDPGAVTEWEGTDLFSLLKHDGVWRIVALSFQSNG